MSSSAPDRGGPAGRPVRLPGWLTPTRVALLVWLLLAGAMLVAYAGDIATLTVGDPDDALRLVQVRDLLAGQPWWDVGQHRINPAGGGGLMHWSRLVDAPLALGIAALTPILGADAATGLVMALWPLLLLGAAFLALARLTSTLGDPRIARLAPLLLAADAMILYQFTPLRIDHHGWQILLTLVAVMLLLREPDARGGMVLGSVAAALLAISLEGLPAAALIAALAGLEWVWTGRADARARLLAMLATLAGAAALLQFVTRGPASLVQSWCDALSLPYLAALATAAAVTGAGMALLQGSRGGRAGRAVVLAAAGAASAAVLLGIDPACASGPFAALDPLVVHYWYANVREGLPLWQPLDGLAGYSLAPTLVGLVGCWLGWRTGPARRWLLLGGALAGLAILSLLVLRSGATAHAVALPGCALVALRAWDRARGLGAALPRVVASLLPALAVPPVAGAIAAAGIAAVAPPQPAPRAGAPCVERGRLGALATLPPATLLTPLDIGPGLLQHTRHSVVATGHHRNNRAMAATIRVFVGDAARAERRARALGAGIIVVCPAASEWRNFVAAPGDSLARRLSRGMVPAWLEPVPLGPGVPLRAWRIVPPTPARVTSS